MSVEVQIAFPCPHLVVEEPVVLGSDRQTLTPKAPMVNANAVRVLANDRYYIPSMGLYSQAILVAAKPGPFRIRRCVDLIGPDGNLIVITTSGGSVSIRLPEGDRVTTAAVEKAIRLAVGTVVQVGITPTGAIALVDINSVGANSFVRVEGKGATAIGFTEQTGARGKMIYPPWQLINRDTVEYPSYLRGLTPPPTRYPKFVVPLKGNPDLKVTYATQGEQCPRCRGTFVENDWRFDPQGEVILIDNENLLYQACLKALLTVKGSNVFHPNYGSSITERIGSKLVGAALLQIQEDVRAALVSVQSVQLKQQRYQTVTDKERLYAIIAATVTQGDDPTTVLVNVTVQNASAQPIALSIVFTVPGVAALAGSNGLTLGLERTGLSATTRV